MAGLPKKYAKMGFKKGWAAYKKSKRSTTKPKTSNSTKRRTKTKTMARKRRTTRRTRRSYAGTKKVTAYLIGGGLYGAVRAKISSALAPVTSKIPLGTIGDEAALFALGYYANKKFGGAFKDMAQAAMAVEAARMGEAFANGSAFSGSSNGAGMSGFPTLG